MKYFNMMITFVALFFINVNAQMPIDEETGKVEYSDVVNISGATSSQLFDRAKEWFPYDHGTTRKIFFEDKTKGVITGDCAFPIFMSGSTKKVHFTFKLQFKDGRYKYTASDFVAHFGTDNKVTYEDRYLPDKRDVYDDTNDKVNKMLKELAAAMKTAVETDDEDDW